MNHWLASSLLLPLAASTAARAADAVSALKGHDTHAPVNVTADRIEVQDNVNRAIFTGSVKIVQNEMTLTAARVTVYYNKPPAGSAADAGPQVQRMDASGDVLVVDPSETARGDFGVYDTQRRLITMFGTPVTLTRGKSVVHGARLVTDLDSGRSTLDGSAVGGGTVGGRVTGTFSVPPRKSAPAATTPTTP